VALSYHIQKKWIELSKPIVQTFPDFVKWRLRCIISAMGVRTPIGFRFGVYSSSEVFRRYR
jgi:hypothetical protein